MAPSGAKSTPKANEFKLGDRVFAKVRGWPAWPARIDMVCEKGKFAVFFYGTHDTCYLHARDLYLYTEETKAKLAKENKRRGFNEGLWEIENEQEVLIEEVRSELKRGVLPRRGIQAGTPSTPLPESGRTSSSTKSATIDDADSRLVGTGDDGDSSSDGETETLPLAALAQVAAAASSAAAQPQAIPRLRIKLPTPLAASEDLETKTTSSSRSSKRHSQKSKSKKSEKKTPTKTDEAALESSPSDDEALRSSTTPSAGDRRTGTPKVESYSSSYSDDDDAELKLLVPKREETPQNEQPTEEMPPKQEEQKTEEPPQPPPLLRKRSVGRPRKSAAVSLPPSAVETVAEPRPKEEKPEVPSQPASEQPIEPTAERRMTRRRQLGTTTPTPEPTLSVEEVPVPPKRGRPSRKSLVVISKPSVEDKVEPVSIEAAPAVEIKELESSVVVEEKSPVEEVPLPTEVKPSTPSVDLPTSPEEKAKKESEDESEASSEDSWQPKTKSAKRPGSSSRRNRSVIEDDDEDAKPQREKKVVNEPIQERRETRHRSSAAAQTKSQVTRRARRPSTSSSLSSSPPPPSSPSPASPVDVELKPQKKQSDQPVVIDDDAVEPAKPATPSRRGSEPVVKKDHSSSHHHHQPKSAPKITFKQVSIIQKKSTPDEIEQLSALPTVSERLSKLEVGMRQSLTFGQIDVPRCLRLIDFAMGLTLTIVDVRANQKFVDGVKLARKFKDSAEVREKATLFMENLRKQLESKQATPTIKTPTLTTTKLVKEPPQETTPVSKVAPLSEEYDEPPPPGLELPILPAFVMSSSSSPVTPAAEPIKQLPSTASSVVTTPAAAEMITTTKMPSAVASPMEATNEQNSNEIASPESSPQDEVDPEQRLKEILSEIKVAPLLLPTPHNRASRSSTRNNSQSSDHNRSADQDIDDETLHTMLGVD